MAFQDWQLDEIRKLVPVSEVVASRFKLQKHGSEFVVADNPSFTVNDRKGFWCEFGKGGDGKPHDIFAFLEIYEGFTFVGAVEELAKRAGVTLEKRPGQSGTKKERNGSDHREEASKPAAAAQKGKREVVATWDYIDPENRMLYQVVRMQERLPNGEWRINREGKTWKTFIQRRPSPDNDGTWILGLDVIDRETGFPLDFLKLANSDAWLRANEERLRWNGITTRQFKDAHNVDHWLYNANEVLDELQEPKEDQRTIFMPEGEAKVDVLSEWGLLGITNSGGAKNFTESCAEFFRNARHVVLLQDNDRAGAERTAKIAPMLKAVGVELIQTINFRDFWPKCPDKGDIKDWRDHGGGTRDALLEIVDQLKPWVPEPYKSKFGAKTAIDLNAPARAYPWRLKGIIPLNDKFLLMGPSGSGKTYEMLNICMHTAMDKGTFAGRKLMPGGIVYCAYEGVSGFENRVRSYLKHHGLTGNDLHSFAWLTQPPNLFSDEDKVRELGHEVLELSRQFKLPLGAVVVDTHNASTRGSSEVKSDDISKIMNHHDVLSSITGVPLWIVGHTNAEGKHRGNEQLYNTIETTMLVEKLHENNDPKKPEKRDNLGRVIRRARIKKQRDGSDTTFWDFVLEKVDIGVDEDGEAIPGMVSMEPVTAEATRSTETSSHERPEGVWLNDTMVSQFQALLRALDEKGVPPPPSLQLPRSVTRVITSSDLGAEWRRKETQEEGETYPKYMARTKASLNRFKQKMGNQNVIGIDHVDRSTADKQDVTYYIWPTNRRVRGRSFVWPSQRRFDPPPAQPSLLAPGESDDQVEV
jgi:hypothetical protein